MHHMISQADTRFNCCMAFTGGQLGAVRGSSPTNVILVMTDDQGYGDVRSHGNSLIDTPNLDRLAQQDARF
ncbi:MAG: hypothetical protein Aurels2KO_34610 [Aureliella sp.]